MTGVIIEHWVNVGLGVMVLRESAVWISRYEVKEKQNL